MKEKELFIPDTACRFVSTGRGWKEAPVLCRREHIRSDMCANCGFNPVVKLRRLAKVYGADAAYDAIEFSEAQSAEYRVSRREVET